MMGFHIRDRGLGRKIASHEKRLREIESALGVVGSVLNNHGQAINTLAATSPRRTKDQLAERARVKAALSVVPPIA